VKETEVTERVYEPGRLRGAWQRVKENAGAAGIDRMTIAEFEAREDELLELIEEKLRALSYRLKPARRALIPKGGSKTEKRKLGIPVVMDRVVAQKHAPGIRRDIRSGIYRGKLWLSPEEEATSGDRVCEGPGGRRIPVVCIDRFGKLL